MLAGKNTGTIFSRRTRSVFVNRGQFIIFLALGCQAEHESAQNGKRVEEKERLRFGLGFRLRLVYSSFLVPSFTATQFSLRNYQKEDEKFNKLVHFRNRTLSRSFIKNMDCLLLPKV